jgi:hypothetical protein
MGLFDFIFGRKNHFGKKNHCRLGIWTCSDCPHQPKVNWKKIQREKGYMYFIGKDGFVWAAPMKHNKTGVKKRVGTERVEKCKYFIQNTDDE